MYRLMVLSLIVMTSNAEAERSFSIQNRIKTRLRCCIGVDQLERLIHLSYAKISIQEFPFHPALQEYMLRPHRWYWIALDSLTLKESQWISTKANHLFFVYLII